jgi:uncharacterized Tic20 family protein
MRNQLLGVGLAFVFLMLLSMLAAWLTTGRPFDGPVIMWMMTEDVIKWVKWNFFNPYI